MCQKQQRRIWVREGYWLDEPDIDGWIEFQCPECDSELDYEFLEKLGLV